MNLSLNKMYSQDINRKNGTEFYYPSARKVFPTKTMKLEMLHPQQVEPQLEGGKTGDYITIKGTPNINMAITPEVPGGIGTIAMVVNMIPHVINARPGLKTMIDLPVPRAIMGDMRDMIEEI